MKQFRHPAVEVATTQQANGLRLESTPPSNSSHRNSREPALTCCLRRFSRTLASRPGSIGATFSNPCAASFFRQIPSPPALPLRFRQTKFAVARNGGTNQMTPKNQWLQHPTNRFEFCARWQYAFASSCPPDRDLQSGGLGNHRRSLRVGHSR